MAEDSQTHFVNHLISLLMQYQQGDTLFKHVIQQKAAELGITKFIEEIARPLGIAIGEMWYRGEMNIFIERYYSIQLTELLNDLIMQNDVQKSIYQPRILLGTLTGEKHILGLNMAQVLLCSQGAFCINLGAELPASEFIDAVEYFKINVIGLSFSPVFPKRMMLSLLRQMRSKLPSDIEMWIGGKGTEDFDEKIEGISVLNGVEEIMSAYQTLQHKLLMG